MSIGGGTHWQGPLLGGAGLFEDCPAMAQSSKYGWFFPDPYFRAPLAVYWSATNLVAGTTTFTITAGRRVAALTHNVANQGPSIRLSGTSFADGTVTPSTNLVPVGAVGQTASASMEATLWPTEIDAATPSNFFVGFANGGAIHPLSVAGVLDVAGALVDGVGFLWTASNTPTLTLADNDAIRTLTGLPTLAAWAVNTPRRYGVRVDQGPTDVHVVSWYINGRLIHRARPGATGTGSFSSNNMTPYIGLVTEAANAVTVNVASCVVATKEFDLE